MLKGRPTVFLSCSEKFKKLVALPVRSELDHFGVYGVIVSESPQLPRTGWTPDDKVESYLDASDAFVALCTADNELTDGTVECRQNVIDEIQRARNKPHLRDRLMVLKASQVRLPSNINPISERLEPENIKAAVSAIVEQLRTWDVLETVPLHAPSPETVVPVDELISKVYLGEHEKATALAYEVALQVNRGHQLGAVAKLLAKLRQTANEVELDDNLDVHIISTVLEGMARIDHTLVSLEEIEELSLSPETTHRITAVDLLWDLAESSPGLVPLGILGRLAKPATEDWYVEAPAIAIVKLLMLKRRQARIVFDRLARSKDPQDRYEVAGALLDLASVEPAAVPPDLARFLARDDDELVAKKAKEVRKAISHLPENAYIKRFSPFGI